MKHITAILLTLVILSTSVMAFSSGEPSGGRNGMRAGGGMTDKSSDAELQEMIEEIAPKFELLTFTDEVSGIEIQYQFFIPEEYDEAKNYPLLMFIPDSSVVGKGADAVLTQGWGGLIWATESEQAKHPSFILVPVFTGTVVDDNFNHSEQIEVVLRLIDTLTEQYSIDTKRLYTTGQSMGGMTSFYINVTYPDIFAATLYVASQWDNSILDALEDTSFFYIVSAGDPKASAGQSGLIEVFEEDGTAYSHAEWSAQDDVSAQNAAVTNMLSEGNSANFVTFTLGTTSPTSNVSMTGAGEHMTSFDYAYKIEAVRDWLFDQSKDVDHAAEVKAHDLANKFGNAADYSRVLSDQLASSEAGERKSPRYVGLIYELGLGVDADPATAAEYYALGVERGDLTSGYYLSLLYEQGLGVEQNYEKAAELLSTVAASDNKSATGVVEAGYELGVLYETGLGVEQDLDQASELYAEAARYGNESAAEALILNTNKKLS